MVSRTAKIATSLVVGILAGAPLFVPQDAANAADCLTAPRQDTPQGQHWYYRLEHGTKRHCWYTRDEGGKVAQTASSDDAAPAPSAPRRTEEQTRALEDAHAEFPAPPAGVTTSAAPVAPPAPAVSVAAATPPQTNLSGSTVAARWPTPDGTDASANVSAPPPVVTAQVVPAPEPTAAPAAAAEVAASADDTDTTASTAAPARSSVSLQMLFAVIIGALALAGLIASIVLRLARGRVPRIDPQERRAAIWDGVETTSNEPPHAPAHAPWIEPEIALTAPLPNSEREIALTAPLPNLEPNETQNVAPEQQRYDKFEEILAQLVRQGQESEA